jgi:hypothetical protein
LANSVNAKTTKKVNEMKSNDELDITPPVDSVSENIKLSSVENENDLISRNVNCDKGEFEFSNIYDASTSHETTDDEKMDSESFVVFSPLSKLRNHERIKASESFSRSCDKLNSVSFRNEDDNPVMTNGPLRNEDMLSNHSYEESQYKTVSDNPMKSRFGGSTLPAREQGMKGTKFRNKSFVVDDNRNSSIIDVHIPFQHEKISINTNISETSEDNAMEFKFDRILAPEDSTHDDSDSDSESTNEIYAKRRVARDLSVFQGQSPLRSVREYAYGDIYGEESVQFGETNPIFSS